MSCEIKDPEEIEAPVEPAFFLKEIVCLTEEGLDQFASQTLCDGESVRNYLLDIYSSAMRGINNQSLN